MPERKSQGQQLYEGIPGSSGIAHGRIVLAGRVAQEIPQREISETEVPEELGRLRDALIATQRDLMAIQKQVATGIGASEASIFEAHMLILEDPSVLNQIRSRIEKQLWNAERAVQDVFEAYAASLAAVDDVFLRERAVDVRDIASRVLNHLMGVTPKSVVSHWKEPGILVAHDLSPAEMATLDRSKVLGFATEVGGRTGHTAIMARKLGLPAVVGLGEAIGQLHNGDYALVDGHEGLVFVNPTDQTLFGYGQLKQRREKLEERLRALKDLPAVTLDGHRIVLAANIDNPGDIEAVSDQGAEGVGLFRSEFLFLGHSEEPDEQEQHEAYLNVAQSLAPHPVVFRTLDLGADKMPGKLRRDDEPNPFLGWRAIRICLDRPELFRAQLRAILRAATVGNVRLMYPMICSLDEVRAARAVLEACLEELKAEGIPHAAPAEVGIMIEVPGAALIADRLADEVDFFSLGTNDLTGYTLAVDRLNERVAPLFAPTHPAVLRLMHQTIEAGHSKNRWVGVCGEMAGETALVPLLIGLGVDELSVTPRALPAVKFLIRRLKLQEVRDLARQALQCDSPEAVQSLSARYAREVAPELFP